jgi:antitoxin component of MazEF toxin-antitoxin module
MIRKRVIAFTMSEAQQQHQMAKDVRRIIKFGKGLAVTIPKEYARNHGLQPGGQLDVAFNDILVMKPVTQQQVEQEIIETLQEAGYPVVVEGQSDNEEEASE